MILFRNLIAAIVCAAGFLSAQDAVEAVRKNDRPGLAALLEKNPSLAKERDADGNTPLHWAARAAAVDLDMVRLLLDKGADVNARDKSGMIPLHEAAGRAQKDLVALLVARGSDRNAKDASGRTPLTAAATKLPFGYRIPPDRIATVRLLVEAGAGFPTTGEDAAKFLHIAAAGGYEELAEAMVDRGVDGSTKNADDGNLLHSAAAGGLADLIGKLGRSGPDPNGRNRYGLTPLHVAAILGNTAAAERLCGLGADPGLRCPAGKTALDYASEGGFKEMILVLAAKGALSSGPIFPRLAGPYLGQGAPGPEPELFAPGLISTLWMDHGPAVFSSDGREVFWTRALGATGGVFTMKEEAGRWTPPRRLSLAKLRNQEMPALSPDGLRLFFNAETPDGSKRYRLWYSVRRGDAWGEAAAIEAVNTGFENSQPSVTKDGTLYFSSGREGGIGGFDIYRSRLVAGRYQKPENLGSTINTEGLEIHPFVAADESYLIFASDRPGGLGGYDLYISFRTNDEGWSKPVNMGERINGGGTINWIGAVSPDGKFFFFTSNRNGNLDVWWADASFIQGLRLVSREALSETPDRAGESLPVIIDTRRHCGENRGSERRP